MKKKRSNHDISTEIVLEHLNTTLHSILQLIFAFQPDVSQYATSNNTVNWKSVFKSWIRKTFQCLPK
jgi:mevalonate pyrophosphate decarboxylase